ncbi:MAG: hypothetical protein IKF78_09980 [Atopobiaceae bacterium]|nr:hypothetical protein [Atopobiaceae bacterium]
MCDTNLTETINQIEKSGVIELCPDDERPDASDKVRTNIPKLDKLLDGGLKPGLHCVTGGPSSYKSALLLQIAYLAAMDGRDVNYVTDEISARECWQRLTTRKMQVDKIVSGGTHGVPSWASLEDVARSAEKSGDVELLGRVASAIHDVKRARWISPDYGKLARAGFTDNGCVWLMYNDEYAGYLSIEDMGRVIYPGQNFTNDECDLFLGNTRYLVSAIQQSGDDGYLDWMENECHSDLLIIDAVNSLRMFEYTWDGKYERYYYCDHMPEPRTRMETIVQTLDNWGRSRNIAIIGVFHGNRTRGQNQQHPCMGDFKETSANEYRAVTAWELVRAGDMRWSGHPKAPDVPDGMEAVGLFLLKSRGGQRTENNNPIWLAADGAHNLIMPLDELRK